MRVQRILNAYESRFSHAKLLLIQGVIKKLQLSLSDSLDRSSSDFFEPKASKRSPKVEKALDVDPRKRVGLFSVPRPLISEKQSFMYKSFG